MGAHIIPQIIAESAAAYADIPAVRWAVKKEIFEHTYQEMDADRKSISAALKKRGFEGSQLALIGPSSYPWITSYLGIVSGKFTAVPLDVGLPADEIVDLINRSDSKVLFIGEKLEALLLDKVKAECPKMELIVRLDEAESTEDGVTTFGDLLKEADPSEYSEADIPGEDDVCTFIYTSGTTGKSKGVMLTQRNLYDNVKHVYVTAEPGSVMLSVLPIHHAYCLVMDWMMGFSKGATLAINDSLIRMVKNIGKFQPHIMLMVPLMIETIYKRLEAAATDPSIPKKAIGQKVFGPNLDRIFSGGAHLDPFYIDAMAEYGVEVCEGYGMSECSPVISTNGELGNKPGSVGKLLGNVEARFVDGELQVKGSSVMKGYYQMPKETEETLIDDGWLRTGDLGHIDEDGYLFITGRLKNLIILSNGENISPEEVEGAFALTPAVGEIVITGENNGLCARVFPSPEYMEAKELSEEDVRAELQEAIDAYNKKQPTYRAITELVVRKYPFIKSSTKKIKRPLAEVDEPPEE